MNKKIQKAVAIILGACTICSVLTFTACSKQDATKEESIVATEKAKIKDADAINYIESYSSKQLGLTDEEKKACSFMVASDGEEIDGKKYIKIIAAIKNEQKGDDGKQLTPLTPRANTSFRSTVTKCSKRAATHTAN